MVNSFLAGFIYRILASYRCVFSLFQFRTFSISISHSFHNALNRRHLFMCIENIFNLFFFKLGNKEDLHVALFVGRHDLLFIIIWTLWNEYSINWTKSLNWTRFTRFDRSYLFYSGWLYAWPLFFNLKYLKHIF